MDSREFCYSCYRPLNSCMSQYIKPIDTKTKFIILMHPKEYRKTKNGTGHFTNKGLKNSHLYIGIDFSNHLHINKILNDASNDCYLLYPGEDSINLTTTQIKTEKTLVIFIIDSTWPCSKKMLRVSKNLQNLKKISFDSNIVSKFSIKKQPSQYCLSTIESTQEILKLLNKYNIEKIQDSKLNSFITPFTKMVEFQLNCAKELSIIRYK